MKHVETYHQEKIQEYYRDKDKKKPRGNKRDSSSSYSSVPQKKIKALSSEDQRLVDRKLAIWLARYQRPMALVEDERFWPYLNFVANNLGGIKLHVSHRTELRDNIIGLATGLRSKLQAILKDDCLDYFLTTDIWTDLRQRSFMAVTSTTWLSILL
ncbi:hypothetical protein F443_14727 [Phytophthora nicotianae P1569]|uniref:HAT C-terminal dimerisation domain-containing protein n=1 Tax=Phytophthora nicotianae P1569 TaxID=1317065 RepID=V9EKB7_PHYNI|nr:hypothetical protein F443_14727 [Phytophthora nicotianae P1569]